MAAKRCEDCGHRPVIGGTKLSLEALYCEPCLDYQGWENQHSDEGHTHDNIHPSCPICAGEDPKIIEEPLAETPHGVEIHTSHAGCSHPRTKSGRAACRRERAKSTDD